MPNRIIKESICRSGSIDSLSWFEEVLFYRLIVVCDDYGRFDGRLAIIRGSCFPLKDMRLDQIEDALKKLAIAGMIQRYKTEDGAFLQLTAWGKHQQIRAKNSKYPAPVEEYHPLPSKYSENHHEIVLDINGNQMISDDIGCPRNRESRIEIRESRSENTGAHAIRPLRFEEFWDAYPNKQRRHLAEKAYCDLIVSGIVTEDALISAAANYAAHVQESGEKMFLPNNFLEKCVFEDYQGAKHPGVPKLEEPEPEPEGELIGEDEEWWKYGPNGWEE